MASDRTNSFSISLVIIGMLVLSGCKTTSESWVLNGERTKSQIEQSLIEDDWSTGVDLIRHINKQSYNDLMPWLKDRAHTFPPAYLYAMADRMYKSDNEGSMKWFIAARVRHTYDLLRCKNTGAFYRLDIFKDRFRKTVFKFAAKNPKRAHEVALAGLAWDADNPIHRTSPVKECMLAEEYTKNHTPFRGIYYPVTQRNSYQSTLIKPSWTHSEMLDLARVKTKRFVENLKFKTVKNREYFAETDEEEEETETRNHKRIPGWQPYRD